MYILKPGVIEERLKSPDYIIEFRNMYISYKYNINDNLQQLIPVSSYSFNVVEKTWSQSRRTKINKDTFKNLPAHVDIAWVLLSVSGVIKANKDYSQVEDYETNIFMENICKQLLNIDFPSTNNKYRTFFHTLKLITIKNENINVRLSYSERNWFQLQVDSIYMIKKYF